MGRGGGSSGSGGSSGGGNGSGVNGGGGDSSGSSVNGGSSVGDGGSGSRRGGVLGSGGLSGGGGLVFRASGQSGKDESERENSLHGKPLARLLGEGCIGGNRALGHASALPASRPFATMGP